MSRSHFSSQALQYLTIAIDDCADEPLPLPLPQALILVSHRLLIQGVRGKAWRCLGLTIRAAYELNLHLIDAGRVEDGSVKVDYHQWCKDEEHRRAWWAIWEMDVFVSVIHRCPPGIDWPQNETFLPVEQHKWEQEEPQRSCTLRQRYLERYKALEATGNQSPKAWFIVINSLMKDAQMISSLVGVEMIHSLPSEAYFESGSAEGEDTRYYPRPKNASRPTDCMSRLRAIHNVLQCVLLGLPRYLQCRNQYLDFGTHEKDRQSVISCRLLHSSIYSINVILQLTRLMIYK